MTFTRMRIDASILRPQALGEVRDFLSDAKNQEVWDKTVPNIEPVGTARGARLTGCDDGAVGHAAELPDQHGTSEDVRVPLAASSMFREAGLSLHLEQTGGEVRILHRLDLRLRNVLPYPVSRLTARRALGGDFHSRKDWLAKTYPPA